MQTNFEFLKSFQTKSALVAAAIGGSIPLSWLLFLVIFGKGPFENWMFIPLGLIPFGGAIGGLFFYLMGFVWFPNDKSKLVAIIFSSVLYFLGIWLSAVLAFSITGHWD
ncbi:hypothetical protein SAMN04489724_0493 [Algoriphagus locisalis]|uniref:Uncharacterized protein n=1 Tax=Algoriphagus locisalis TaxID=305507 RepID=A0A1I6XIB5_9BACT|nr:hypothetical protein [Algoriphagus locisalis]SFT37876.1 hypothetical protein SAMN04489724_0493 [Algoriphagus locisalis]